jgi:CBS domain-containing protein
MDKATRVTSGSDLMSLPRRSLRRAKDVMQTRVTRISPDAPLVNVHRLFCDEGISGAPVVDEAGYVVGTLTIRDVLNNHRVDLDCPEQGLAYFRDDFSAEFTKTRTASCEIFEWQINNTASGIMSKKIVSVSQDAPLCDVVERMTENRVHRLIVLDRRTANGRFVGIISVFDLIQLLD